MKEHILTPEEKDHFDSLASRRKTVWEYCAPGLQVKHAQSEHNEETHG